MFHATSANCSWPLVFGTSHRLSLRKFFALRCSLAVLFLVFLVTDLILRFQSGYWWIYLTRWTFFLETVYLVLACYVAWRARASLKAQGPTWTEAAEAQRLPRSVQVMWLLWSIVMPASIVITCAFWTLIKPVWHLDAVPTYNSLFEHLINTALLFVELFYSRNPFRARHAGLLFAYSAIYLFWTLIHFWLKVGVPEEDPCTEYSNIKECPVYSCLDWHLPGRTFVVILAIVILASAVIFLVWCCTHWRNKRDYASQRSNLDENNLPEVSVQQHSLM